jgi:hypothetical protein
MAVLQASKAGLPVEMQGVRMGGNLVYLINTAMNDL